MKHSVVFSSVLVIVLLSACGRKEEITRVQSGPVTESVYASGSIKAKNQYQVFAQANGIVESILVKEGDTVKKGQTLLSIANDIQRLSKENAELAARFADLKANQGKIVEATSTAEMARIKMLSDSLMFARQSALWAQNIGSKVELEQRELAFKSAKTTYRSAQLRLEDLKRQLEFGAAQANKNLSISDKSANDYTVKSEIDGVVYTLFKEKGEMVSAQTPLAVVGDAFEFILEMQVDEYDIVKIKPGQTVLVTLDSYKGQVFEARVNRVFPLMNERSKTFLVEAGFVKAPPVLYPNISFEANIITNRKSQTLLIPRNYLVNDSTVLNKKGDPISITTGLKDYQVVEVLNGLNQNDELLKPN